ncbi:hypothetical protein GNI_070930 [Gregarina niphandrodes]|uniref:Uncharacterized protein n=1 Tax=Gregarina niphandrodes TaxID=110365 RepID=A0A023B7F5_GRENI|nr:hypothetical protein GNI_070930 [Gregarina niphandrodes]EZG67187.1 hypothetical protein GNI_070930 [Gregarina niphandrodes]|eukprot:XP_011130316.1 hypothetical protein GNI_070930 [Gregarina niphandrodes]
MKDVSAETIAYSFGQVDCTENYDLVAESFQRCGAGDMAPELWISKLALGPIDASYKGLAEDD